MLLGGAGAVIFVAWTAFYRDAPGTASRPAAGAADYGKLLRNL